MSLRFEFGDRNHPIGLYPRENWELKKPNWKQKRGIEVAEVVRPQDDCGEVDALWTRLKNQPVAVTTADCVPLLFYRKDETAIAAVHAGWEGTLHRIVPHFFQALPANLKNPGDWEVKIGPSIRACCYEFGENLIEKFQKEFRGLRPNAMTPIPRHLDLIAILKHEVDQLGVRIASIAPECTRCTRNLDGALRYFTYRGGDRNSRQYSLIEIS